MEKILSTADANDRSPTKPKRMNQEENCKRYIIIKLFKANDKEKIFFFLSLLVMTRVLNHVYPEFLFHHNTHNCPIVYM